MKLGLFCQIEYGSDFQKIGKFLEETQIVNFVCGENGLAFISIAPKEICYYAAMIHRPDIYKLSVKKNNSTWRNGGIVREFRTEEFISFIKKKGKVGYKINFQVDDKGSNLVISVYDNEGNNIRSTNISLSPATRSDSYPSMTYANYVWKVNEFKKLASMFAKSPTDIKIEAGRDSIRFSRNNQNEEIYGDWDPEENHCVCYVSGDVFKKATKINIGNTKNSLAGVYVGEKLPLKIKVKLGVVNFEIFGKTEH